MLLLAIESSGSGGSAALARLGTRSGDRFEISQRSCEKGPADHLIAIVDQLLEETGFRYPEIGLLAVGIGPGSFTGVRTAIAAVRGLALAMGRPVLPVTTFEALVLPSLAPLSAPIVAAIDARRNEVYLQPFPAGRVSPPEPARALAPAVAAAELQSPVLLIGSGAPLLAAHLDRALVFGIDPRLPDAAGVAIAAEAGFAAGVEPVPGFEVQPVYLRSPDARPMRAPIAAPAHQSGS